MPSPKHNSRGFHVAVAACIAFFIAGQLFIPLLGIEDDESLFAAPILPPKAWEYVLHLGRSHIALMMMSYLGTLKTFLYKPLLLWFGTGVWTVREPVVAAGAVSIWLFYLLLRRIAGHRAAVVGCCLLASDTLYLLTSVFDWGPVALQHLLLTAGLLLLVIFYQDGRERALAGACFLFGLALWDKALAVWMLSGMAVAAAVLFWREIRRVTTARRIAVAALAFSLGAMPFLIYNAATRGNTFRGNIRKDTSDLAGRFEMLKQTVRGTGLIGTLTEEALPPPVPHQPSGVIQDASANLAAQTGHPLRNLSLYGFLLALLLAPLAYGRGLRVILFALVAMALAWIQMATTKGTGGSVHHTILLWPLPYMVMAVSFAAASSRLGRAAVPALTAVTALLAVSSVLVTNEYYARMVRQGGSVAWTDAISTLADTLRGTSAPYIFCVDWGIMDNLRLLGNGKLPVRDGIEHTSVAELTTADRDAIRQMLAIPGAIFIGHTKETEFFHGDTARLLQVAGEAGYQPERAMTIGDSFGRPVFEVYRFSQPASAAAEKR